MYSDLKILGCLPPLRDPKMSFCRITLNGLDHRVLIDNQASDNIMSLNFAKTHHILVEPAYTAFILADGRPHYSIGKASVHCVFDSGEKICFFHVFPQTVFPLVLGRPLLREMGLFGPGHPPDTPVQIRLDNHTGTTNEALAILDRGSSDNIMSLSFARRHGYLAESSHLPEEGELVSLGNGIRIRTLGTTKARLQLPVSQTRGEKSRNRHRLLGIQFTIVEGFPYDLALGNSFTRKHMHDTASWDWDWEQQKPCESPVAEPDVSETGLLFLFFFSNKGDRNNKPGKAFPTPYLIPS